MRRVRRIAALPVLILLSLIVGASTAAAAHAAAAPAAACSGTIRIDSFAFSTTVVTAGQSAVATVTATNCTAQPISPTVEAYGRFFGPGGQTLPPGCPVVDPIAMTANFAANGQYTNKFGTSTFTQCSATSYEEFVSFMISGVTVASATATVAIQGGAASSCTVVYTEQSRWQGGFVASISITNTGTVPISSWLLGFTFNGDQQIANAWNAQFTQTGETVKMSGTPSDMNIAPGATLSGIGFIGTWHTSDAPPSTFTVNGTICS